MAKQVELPDFPCLNQEHKLRQLNEYIAIHDEIEPDGIASATGCQVGEAMEVLMWLFDKYLAEQYIAVYHKEHPYVRIELRHILEGFPSLPLDCPLCDEVIENENELLYSFVFRLKRDIEFVVKARSRQ